MPGTGGEPGPTPASALCSGSRSTGQGLGVGRGSLLRSRPPTMSRPWPAPQGSAWEGTGALYPDHRSVFSSLASSPQPRECLHGVRASGITSLCFKPLSPLGLSGWNPSSDLARIVRGCSSGGLWQFVFALRCVSVAEKRGPETLELRGALLPPVTSAFAPRPVCPGHLCSLGI